MQSGQKPLLYSEIVLTLTVVLRYFIQHGNHTAQFLGQAEF